MTARRPPNLRATTTTAEHAAQSHRASGDNDVATRRTTTQVRHSLSFIFYLFLTLFPLPSPPSPGASDNGTNTAGTNNDDLAEHVVQNPRVSNDDTAEHATTQHPHEDDDDRAPCPRAPLSPHAMMFGKMYGIATGSLQEEVVNSLERQHFFT